MKEITNQSLSPACKRLVKLMQKLHFGTIPILPVKDGQPVLDPLPRVVRCKKKGGINQARPQAESTDFVLKREVVDLLQDIKAIGSGNVLKIVVAHGLPILYEYEDVIRV